MLVALACLACDDGSGSTTPPRKDAGPLPDLGVPPSCVDMCTTYRTQCGEALLLQACDGCQELFQGAAEDDHPETYNRAIDLCNLGNARENCKAMAGCLSDNDGLTAVARSARVSIQGSVFDISMDLVDEAAVVVLGTKNDGGPSDLVAYLVVDDAAWRLEIDDLGADADDAPLDAEDNNATLDSVGASVLLDSGRIEVNAFEPTGSLSVSGTLAPAERPDDALEINIEGTWEGQF